ncbi:TonB-dependent receptor [Luteitalea sp.]
MPRLLRTPAAVLCACAVIMTAAAPATAAPPHDRITNTAAAQPAAPPPLHAAESAAPRVVSGIVRDAGSNVPVAGATVTAGDARVITGADGRFIVPAQTENVTLHVVAAGYFDLDTTVSVASPDGSVVELVIVRERAISEHAEVRSAAPGAAPATRRVDPVEVLRTPGALDNIFRALQTLPGVVATQEALGYMSVRGGSPDQNLTLLDGVEVHDPYRLYGLASAFNPDTIQRFDLATGGFSARYGDRLSSLLTVESRDGAAGRSLGGQAALSITDANVVLEGAIPRIDGGSWLVSARRTYYDVVADLVSDQTFPGFNDLQAKGTWAPRAGRKLTVFGLRSRQGGDFRIDDDDVDVRFQDKTQNTLGWARFETTIGSRVHAMTAVGHSHTRIDTGFDGLFADPARRSNAPGVLPVRQATVRYGYATLVRDLSARQELSWAARAHTLHAGAEVHGLSTTLDFSLLGDRNPNVNGSSLQGGAGLPDELRSEIRSTRGGAWVEDTWALGPTVSLQSGLRIDHVGATRETLVSPRLSAAWSPGTSTRVRAAFGRYTQSPGYEKFGQTDYLLDLTDPARVGLRSQQALVSSASLERDLGTSASVRVEGYYKHFDDLLVGRLESEPVRLARVARYDFPGELQAHVPTDAIITSTPSNDGQGRAYGVDVLVRRTTVSSDTRLRGWASYTWGKAEREAYGLRFPFEYDRRHAVSTVLAYQLSPRWELATTTRVASGFARTEALGLRVAGTVDTTDSDGDGRRDELLPERDADGRLVYMADFGGVANLQRGRLPVFLRVDARLTWRSSSRRWEIYGEVLNVTNRKNAGALAPRLDHDPSSDRPLLTEVREQSLPLLPTLGLRVRF